MMKSGHEMVKYRRIVVLSTNEFDGSAGSEVLWAEAVGFMAAQGHQIEVNTPDWTSVPERIGRLRDVERVRFESRPVAAPLALRLMARLGAAPVDDYFRSYRRSYLLRCRPELVVISQGGLVDGVAWMESCVELGIPFVAIVHLVADALWPSPNESERASAVYPKAKQVFFVSQHNRALATRQLGMDFTASPIVRNPYNVDYNTGCSWPDTTAGWRLACVGRLGAEHKGQDLLVEVLSSAKWRERPLSVTLYGQGHHRSLLDRLIAHYGTTKIFFGGYTHGISEVWKNHHAMIMPSRYEGLPIALVEAMFCHRMAIVTDVGGNTELLEDGISGFVAASPGVRALDDALERAWAARETWQAMGIEAGKKVRVEIPEDPVGILIQQLLLKIG